MKGLALEIMPLVAPGESVLLGLAARWCEHPDSRRHLIRGHYLSLKLVVSFGLTIGGRLRYHRRHAVSTRGQIPESGSLRHGNAARPRSPLREVELRAEGALPYGGPEPGDRDQVAEFLRNRGKPAPLSLAQCSSGQRDPPSGQLSLVLPPQIRSDREGRTAG